MLGNDAENLREARRKKNIRYFVTFDYIFSLNTFLHFNVCTIQIIQRN